MNIILTLIVALLLYKVKLIDDRKNNNFEKFKNYRKRRSTENPTHGLFEQDEWLAKDIPYQFMIQYESFKNDDGAKWAILDYYRDYNDNEQERSELRLLIILILIYLTTSQSSWLTIALTIISIILCLRQPAKSIFNNTITNVGNNPKSKKIYEQTQKEIEKEILKIRNSNS